MPKKMPRTKAAKATKARKIMREFKEGTLHSGSKTGPVVTNRKQAVAIMMSETGQARKKRKKGK